MDLKFTAEDNLFREQVRGWLRDNIPREPRPVDGPEMRAFDAAWQLKQYEAGYAGMSWPKKYGGRDCSIVERLIWYEEYARAGAPWSGCMIIGLNHAGHIILSNGTEEQKEAHLNKILRGEEVWCQGFSEPGAGSDLAGLKTRAETDGDELVVNGTKIWTSFSSVADYQELLVRTAPLATKHKGLSCVICDMRTPGITVKPIETMVGHWHFAQIFYDDVRLPLKNVVGGLNNGWRVALDTLGVERAITCILDQVELIHALESLVTIAKKRKGPDGIRPAICDEEIAVRLATARAEVNALRSLTYMTVSRSQAGVVPGAEGSIIRLFYSELMQRIRRIAVDILGVDALDAEVEGGWPERYLDMFRATIAAGTSEIQRNIIGEQVLGLPR